jgi:hypothetical protein
MFKSFKSLINYKTVLLPIQVAFLLEILEVSSFPMENKSLKRFPSFGCQQTKLSTFHIFRNQQVQLVQVRILMVAVAIIVVVVYVVFVAIVDIVVVVVVIVFIIAVVVIVVVAVV